MFKRYKIKFIFSVILLILILSSCSSNNLDLDDDITNILVYSYDENILIDTIEDLDFIDNLVKKLDKATTHSTANMDFELPDYKLTFKSGEKEIFKIGYYNKVMNLETEGRYWKYDEDQIYEVKLELPID